MSAPPRVFVSHASEDKERFVLRFAEKLRAKRIDAWLDKWEMLPGDSLVEKIFDEGIKDAAAVIVVVSHASITKPWVKEELNAATVKHIERGTRLIPVVIDDCEVPEPLRTRLWEKIDDVSSYDASFDRIVASIIGQSLKPPLGEAPAYLQVALPPISGLTHTDSLVLKASCEFQLQNDRGLLERVRVFKQDSESGLPVGELVESLKILDHHGYVEIKHVHGGEASLYLITDSGFGVYAENYLPNYNQTVLDAAAAVVNERLRTNDSISERLQVSRVVIDHILNDFESRGFVTLSKEISRTTTIVQVSPVMKRWLGQ